MLWLSVNLVTYVLPFGKRSLLFPPNPHSFIIATIKQSVLFAVLFISASKAVSCPYGPFSLNLHQLTYLLGHSRKGIDAFIHRWISCHVFGFIFVPLDWYQILPVDIRFWFSIPRCPATCDRLSIFPTSPSFGARWS